MSFFKFKNSDILSTTYLVYPSYNLTMSTVFLTTSAFYLFPSTSVKTSRTYTDINGIVGSGSYQLTGNIIFVAGATTREKYVLNRLKNIYSANSFKKNQNYSSSSLMASTILGTSMAYINIPAVLYGSEIKKTSIALSTNTGISWYDDGYGGLYSGSLLLGCVYYEYGIIYLSPLALSGGISSSNEVYINFSGTNITPITTYMCRAPKATSNFSNNPTFTQPSGSLSGSVSFNEILTKNPTTYITTVGLYDENYKLVAVAKVSSPIMNDEQTSILIRNKLNY